MGWFKKAQSDSSDSILLSSLHKQAQSSEDIGDFKDFADADEQWGHNFTLFDVQRYVMDSYGVRCALTRTSRDITVTLLINHNFLGTIAWDEYWSFELDEFDEAKELYKTICKVTKETTDEFIENSTPTSIFWPTLRSKFEQLNITKRVHTNVPYVNYSHDLKISPDWRKNIYGPRYPDYKEISHDTYYGGRVGRQT